VHEPMPELKSRLKDCLRRSREWNAEFLRVAWTKLPDAELAASLVAALGRHEDLLVEWRSLVDDAARAAGDDGQAADSWLRETQGWIDRWEVRVAGRLAALAARIARAKPDWRKRFVHRQGTVLPDFDEFYRDRNELDRHIDRHDFGSPDAES